MIPLLTADTLPVDQFIRMVPPRTAEQGRELHAAGLTQVQSSEPTNAVISVSPKNERPAQVTIRLSGTQVSLSCSCRGPYAWGACKHGIAGVLALRDHLRLHPPSLWRAVLSQAINAPTPAVARSSGSHGAIVFSLQPYSSSWFIQPYSLAGRYLSADHGGNPDIIAAAIEERNLWHELKPIRSTSNLTNFSDMPAQAITAAALALGSGNQYSNNYWQGSPRQIAGVLALLPGCLVYRGEYSDPFQDRLHISDQPGTMQLELSRAEADLSVRAVVAAGEQRIPLHGADVVILTREPMWALVGDRVLPLEGGAAAANVLARYPDVRIPAGDETEFLERFVPALVDRIPLTGDAISFENLVETPEPRLYLSERERDLVAELRFGYGEFELPYSKTSGFQSTRRREGSRTLVRVTRDLAAEQAAWESLSDFGLKRGAVGHEFLLRKNVNPIDFLIRQVPRLTEAGFTIFGEEALTLARINRNRPEISFNVSSGIDWFDLQASVNFGDQHVPLKEIRRAVRKRERFIKLADGTIGEIPPEWIERYRHLFALAEENGEELRISNHHLNLLDDVLAEADRAQTDAAFRERRERLRNFERIEPQPLPPGFTGALRPYQKAAFDWMHFLNSYGFGGCLADDMGTGKTVSTLAFLQSLKERTPDAPATLIVMPRSLLFNWAREAAQFTPGLRVYTHADQGRITEAADFSRHDLVLTTYGVMLRDIELLRSYRFNYVILDESQAIKNPLAETSRAARSLNAEHRLVLTGTPVENSASELWAQFAFLNPGLLGNLDYFREEFVNPIERKQDQDTATFLRKMVHPFILRRTKEQVALDLPPRSEELLEVDMDPAQRKLYNKTRDHYRDLLLGLIDNEGINDARLKVLEGLLRLRQICNHPRLVEPAHRGGSAKLEALLETLDTLRAEGHKALIFSQFVQMLTIVRSELDARKIPYVYLDGSTRKRKEVVDRFQESGPELPFFLISLKAGGVGLNLTAADYVIHVDPWWNPAVEMQATDRTHRIGQTRPVFVYKLITRGTVEEKILELQARKRALVEQLIAADGGMLKALTREDVEVLFS
jgi:non-specific serine/threonine protein kinase